MWYHYIPIRMAKTENSWQHQNARNEAGKSDHSDIVDRNIKWHSHSGKTIWKIK